MEKFAKTIFWLSPFIKIFEETIGAISGGYFTGLIRDPGHRFIKWTDAIISILSISVTIAIIYPSLIYYSRFSDNQFLTSVLVILFPHFTSLYLTGTLYLLSILLHIYNKNRNLIISTINKRKGVW